MLDISIFFFVLLKWFKPTPLRSLSFPVHLFILCVACTRSRDKPAVKLRDLFLYKASSAHDTYERVQCNDLNLSHFSVFLWRVASVRRSECAQWKRLGRGKTLLSSTALTYFYWWLYEDLFRIIFRPSVEKKMLFILWWFRLFQEVTTTSVMAC